MSQTFIEKLLCFEERYVGHAFVKVKIKLNSFKKLRKSRHG